VLISKWQQAMFGEQITAKGLVAAFVLRISPTGATRRSWPAGITAGLTAAPQVVQLPRRPAVSASFPP